MDHCKDEVLQQASMWSQSCCENEKCECPCFHSCARGVEMDENALLDAVMANDIQSVREFIRGGGVDVNAVDGDG